MEIRNRSYSTQHMTPSAGGSSRLATMVSPVCATSIQNWTLFVGICGDDGHGQAGVVKQGRLCLKPLHTDEGQISCMGCNGTAPDIDSMLKSGTRYILQHNAYLGRHQTRGFSLYHGIELCGYLTCFQLLRCTGRTSVVGRANATLMHIPSREIDSMYACAQWLTVKETNRTLARVSRQSK